MKPIIGAIAITLTLVAAAAAATPQVTAGSGAQLVTSQSTGIYVIANLNNAGRVRQTLTLFHKSQLKEVHTRKTVSGTYLARTANSQAIRIPTATFNQLIAVAGGVDRNVETLPAAKRNQFYQLANLGDTAPAPHPQVPPGPTGKCPPGYELIKLPLPPKCRLLSRGPSGLTDWLASLWSRFPLVPEAEAVAIKLFEFALSNVFSNIQFQWDDGLEVYQFRGFGFTVMWTDGPGN